MHLRSRLLSLLLLFPVTGFTSEESPQLIESPQLVESPAESLIGLLEGIDSLRANYSQYTPNTDGSLQKGKFWLARPDQFRVESGPPLSQTIVSDGISLWTHDRDLEQVIISPLDVSANEIPILLFAGNPEEVTNLFSVELYEDETSQHYVLLPLAEDSMFKTIAIRFDQELPSAISIENSLSERTRIDLIDVEIGEAITSDRFTFAVPEFVDVIDDRPTQ